MPRISQLIGPCPTKLSHATALTTVVNTVTESDLWSYTIPAGSVDAGDYLHLTVLGDNLNNSGGTVNARWRIKLGATTIFDTGNIAQTTNATRRSQRIEVDIPVDSLTAQQPGWEFMYAAVTGLLSTGACYAGLTASTENFATDLALKVTIEHGAAAATVDARAVGKLTRYPG